MMIAWILVANGSEARIYQTQNIKNLHSNRHKLELVKEFYHPESRQKDDRLASDRLGHYQSQAGGGGSFVDSSEPKLYESERFAKELANTLEHGRVNNNFQELVLVSSPHFAGILNQSLSDHLSKMVVHQVNKDYTKDSDHELIDHLSKQLGRE